MATQQSMRSTQSATKVNPSPPFPTQPITATLYTLSQSRGKLPTVTESLMTLAQAGNKASKMNLTPETIMNLPSKAGYLETACSNRSKSIFPGMSLTTRQSSNILLTVEYFRGPGSMTASILMLPDWMVTASMSQQALIRSVRKFPQLVSFLLILENLVSKGTNVYPTIFSFSLWYASSFSSTYSFKLWSQSSTPVMSINSTEWLYLCP